MGLVFKSSSGQNPDSEIMEFYAVLLLVAAVSAEADYLHVVPQTHTVLTKQVPTMFKQVQHVPTLYQTVQKPLEDVHTPIVYQTVQKPVEALQTPIVKTLETTDIINPFKIQAVQTPLVIPTLYQHVPTIYQTLQTPTIFKIDEDKLVKVDDDEEEDDEDKEGEVLPLIKPFINKRIVRSADNEDYYISNADHTQFYKVKLDDVDEDEEEEEVVVPYLIHQIPTIHHTPIKTLETTHILKPVEKLEKFDDEHILVRKARSADNIEVKKTDSHFLNLLTNKPTNTPVATTYIHNTMPVEADSVHIVAPRVSVPTNIPVVTTGIKAVKAVHTPVSNVGTTLIHNAKTGVEVVAPRVLVNTVQTPLIKAFNPVQTPLFKAFNTPVVRTLTHTPIVQTPAFKPLETTDIVNPVQKTVQIQTPTLYTTINKPVVTPVQLVNQPIFKTVQTPVVRTVVQTPAEITPGYVAATHGNVHTAPLPEGPSNDGLFASHHINLPNVKA